MKKFIYFVMALMLVMMPVTVSATTTSNGKNLSDLTIKAQVTNNGEVTITLSDVGADYYIIYRDGSQIAKSKSLKYVDKGLDVNSSYNYSAEAYKDNDYSGRKNIDSNVYPVKSLAKPKLTVSKSKNHSTSLDLNITAVAGANDYDVYEVVNGKYKPINYTDNYNGNTITITNPENSYGKHTFAAIAKNTYVNVKSGYTTVTYTYKPESPVVKVKAINYDQNELTIERPQTYNGSSIYDGKFKVYIYRSTDNKKFTKIKTISNIDLYSDTIYKDKIKDVKLGKTYYYKAVFETAGTKSSYGKVVKIKSALTVPVFEVHNGYNDAQTIEILNTGKNVKYEIYQATKKNGKYKKVCDTGKSKCDVKATINKTYYYKVRAYMKVNGKKITTKYSSIKNLKLEMKNYYTNENVKLTSYYDRYNKNSYLARNYDTYVYYNNYAEATVKSVKMTKKSGGNTSKFEMKITYKSKKSDKNKTLPIYATFYNYDYTKAYVVTLNEKFVKGTKKNVTSKHTIRIPRWAMFYSID